MARIATRDTYAVDRASGEEVRRVVKAGDIVPEHYELEAGDTREVPAGTKASATRNPAYVEEGESETAKRSRSKRTDKTDSDAT